MKKGIVSIIVIALVCIATLSFIEAANDHKECEEITTVTRENGGSSVETTHICHETFSF